METKPTLEEVESAAALWLLRQYEGQWSSAQETELAAWLAQSPSHRVAYIRLKSVWESADRLKSIAIGVPKGEVPVPGALTATPYFTLKRGDLDMGTMGAEHERQRSSTRSSSIARSHTRVRLLAFAAAASIIAVVGLTIAAYTTGIFDNGARYTTPVGGLTTVPTADGSSITLNTDTDIRVRITENERSIELKKGEAFFEVAHDATRPFIVQAVGRRVIAVGTKFSVRKERDDVRVAVTEGAVRVDGNVDAPSSTPAGANLLPAGTTAHIAERRIDVRQQPIPEIEESLSWRAGFVVLRRTPLPVAIDEFNRYSTRKVVLEDQDLDTIIVGGNFRTNNLDGFIRLLEQGFDIETSEHDGQVHLTRKRR